MDLSAVSFTLRDGPFFVRIDRGYIGYGRVSAGPAGLYTVTDYESVERFAHFVEWADVPSVRWLRSWCRAFLLSIKKELK